MSVSSEKFAYARNCKTQEMFKVPVSRIHRFIPNEHTPIQAYKIDVKNDVVLGTLCFVANSEQELDEIIESQRRPKAPPTRFIKSAYETSDSEIEKQVLARRSGNGKRKIGEVEEPHHLSARLATLKMEQAKRSREMLTLQCGKSTESTLQSEVPDGNCASKDYVSCKPGSKIQSQKFKKIAPVRPEKLGNEGTSRDFEKKDCGSRKPTSKKMLSTNFTNIVSASKSLNDENSPASKNTGNISIRRKSAPSAPLTAESPLSDVRGTSILDRVIERSEGTTKQELQRSNQRLQNVSSLLAKTEVRLTESQMENGRLEEKLREMQDEALNMQAKISTLEEELRKVNELNHKWQNSAISRCDEMHSMFREWQNSLGGEGEDITAVGYISDNGKEIHLGRGVWVDKTLYTLAQSGVTFKTKRKFVRSMIVSVFGYDMLSKSTISGRKSNRSGENAALPHRLDSKKLLAVKDIYKYFLIKELNMDPCEAEMEADRTNDSVRKKISQLKEVYRKPKKTGRPLLGTNNASNTTDGDEDGNHSDINNENPRDGDSENPSHGNHDNPPNEDYENLSDEDDVNSPEDNENLPAKDNDEQYDGNNEDELDIQEIQHDYQKNYPDDLLITTVSTPDISSNTLVELHEGKILHAENEQGDSLEDVLGESDSFDDDN